MKTGYCHIYNHRMPLDSITDRLHIGNRWLGHLGLAMYDNTARVHDPVMPRMLTCDSRAVDYPGHSHFSHCAGNPANILDPTGMAVIADQWCQEGILDGLSEYESSFIQFDNEVLNNELLNRCIAKSANFLAIKTMANSDLKYIFQGKDKILYNGIEETLVADPSEGKVGVTLLPNCEESPSPDENVYIITSIFTNALKRAENIAHEGYGHAYYYELKRKDDSIDPFHRYVETLEPGEITPGCSFPDAVYTRTLIKANPIELQIKIVENEARKNYLRKYDQ